MDQQEGLLTVEQAGGILQVKPSTIYDWAAKGVLRHVRILAGERRAVIRFRKSDIEDFIRRRTIAEGER